MIYQAGALSLLVGGIFFGQGWCEKNKECKHNGIAVMIVGAIIAVIGLADKIFIA